MNELRDAVDQCDRDAAADWLQSFDPEGYSYPSVRDGTGNANGITEAFAAHRLAAIATMRARLLSDEAKAMAAKAVFACYFAEDEPQDVILEKWHEWPEERENAARRATAALAAALETP